MAAWSHPLLPTVARDAATFTELRIGEGWSAAIEKGDKQ